MTIKSGLSRGLAMPVLKSFTPSTGLLPTNFKDAVGLLQRPYVVISEKLYCQLLEVLKQNNTDFLIYRGKVGTIGNADSGYAFMPLNLTEQALRSSHATKRRFGS